MSLWVMPFGANQLSTFFIFLVIVHTISLFGSSTLSAFSAGG
jgi:hypothetical protein